MQIDLTNLPTDTQSLQALVRVLAGDVKSKGLLIEQLKAQIAKLKRMQFGKSSEKLDQQIAQLELQLDELQEDEGDAAAKSPAVLQALIKEQPEKPYRKPLPDHLLREDEVHEPACTCPNCGGAMRKFGEDGEAWPANGSRAMPNEILDYVPASFKSLPLRRRG